MGCHNNGMRFFGVVTYDADTATLYERTLSQGAPILYNGCAVRVVAFLRKQGDLTIRGASYPDRRFQAFCCVSDHVPGTILKSCGLSVKFFELPDCNGAIICKNGNLSRDQFNFFRNFYFEETVFIGKKCSIIISPPV